MIRPGKMRHLIFIQRVSRVPDAYGTEVATWSHLADLRAEIVEEDAAQLAGETAGTRGRRSVTFRTRVFGGITVDDRVMWQGRAFDIVGVAGGDFTEGRALELKCEGAA